MIDSETTDTRSGRPDDIKAVPVRHYGRWIAAVVILAFAGSVILAAIHDHYGHEPAQGFEWKLVGNYLFDSRILHGVVATIYLTALAMGIGIAGGIGLAVMRLSPNPVVKGAAWLYIYFFRGTPLLVQIIFWFNIAALYPRIGIGIPFGPDLAHINGNTVITEFVAAMLALGLNEAAYMAEIVRAGIISVGEGQVEAASSLGMRRLQIMRHIVLPQAMRVIIPPTGNETISMLKSSSLVSVIGFGELFYEASQIYGANYQTVPLLIVMSIWYLILTSVLYVGQYFIERRFGRGFSRNMKVSLRSRWIFVGSGGRVR